MNQDVEQQDGRGNQHAHNDPVAKESSVQGVTEPPGLATGLAGRPWQYTPEDLSTRPIEEPVGLVWASGRGLRDAACKKETSQLVQAFGGIAPAVRCPGRRAILLRG